MQSASIFFCYLEDSIAISFYVEGMWIGKFLLVEVYRRVNVISGGNTISVYIYCVSRIHTSTLALVYSFRCLFLSLECEQTEEI